MMVTTHLEPKGLIQGNSWPWLNPHINPRVLVASEPPSEVTSDESEATMLAVK